MSVKSRLTREYLIGLVRRAARHAADEFKRKGEPVPSHVRAALDFQKKSGRKRAAGGLIGTTFIFLKCARKGWAACATVLKLGTVGVAVHGLFLLPSHGPSHQTHAGPPLREALSS